MPAITKYLTDILYKKEPVEAPPPITTSTAILLLLLYTLLYVIPFYLSPKTRPSARLSRDAPSVIRARITSVSLTCAVASLSTLAVLVMKGGYENYQAFHAMGYWPLGLGESFRALLLTALLFLGPLFETLVVEGYWREWMTGEPVKELLGDWITWRNLVAGPLTEELLFRSAAIPLMILARTSLTKTIFVSPLVFGLAHVHHLYEFRITHPGVPLPAAILRSVFQLGYTTLFGAYATFVYLRTGSLLAVFGTHVLCNSMGLPRVYGAVMGRGKGGEEMVPVARRWSVAYYVLLVVGAVGWWKELWALTESGNALVAM
ncbi:CAAX prenyl protease [Gnomoniopsis smithogilvyi]|uniref:intramembrane prenyl-peptidase Rce1 n=1 Tax=Gnomoniopsis smithogilvyi TaxID=1191159 RepID=A0A9W8YV33_9PEZI|nr:CAAX prenyl protease [Gnomoniopsis smithogilvyi]